MINFELNFSSSKGDFALNVDSVAVLRKCLIPLTYLVPLEITITTTDQAAIAEISRALLRSPITRAGETECALLVQANDSRWIIFGAKADQQGSQSGLDAVPQTLQIKARMISGHALKNLQMVEVKEGQSVFLKKKVQHALDGHQVKGKGRKRSLVEAAFESAGPESPELPVSLSKNHLPPKAEVDNPRSNTIITKSSTKKRKNLVDPVTEDDKSDAKPFPQKAEPSEAVVQAAALTKQFATDDKAIKDKLKKMIVTLLSVQGILKSDPDFKDLYQHTLQASVFAMRSANPGKWTEWEAQAMNVNQSLIKLFLGANYKVS